MLYFDTSYVARLHLRDAGFGAVYSNDTRLLAAASHVALAGLNII